MLAKKPKFNSNQSARSMKLSNFPLNFRKTLIALYALSIVMMFTLRASPTILDGWYGRSGQIRIARVWLPNNANIVEMPPGQFWTEEISISQEEFQKKYCDGIQAIWMCLEPEWHGMKYVTRGPNDNLENVRIRFEGSYNNVKYLGGNAFLLISDPSKWHEICSNALGHGFIGAFAMSYVALLFGSPLYFLSRKK